MEVQMPTCEICDGTGTLNLPATCRKCQGTGEIITYGDDDSETLEACTLCEYGFIYTEVICDTCHGTGVA